MVRGKCFTNLDGYKNDMWPTLFDCTPNIGDSVQAVSGRKLTVVNITQHSQGAGSEEPVQYIIVELSRRFA